MKKKKSKVKLKATKNAIAQIQTTPINPEVVQNGLAGALFGNGAGIGGGFNPFGFPFNQGNANVPTIENVGTLFDNLRWFFVSNDRQLLCQMYVEFGLVQTIVDVPVDDALRGGITIKSKQLEESQLEELENALDRNDDLNTAGQAAKWNRLFGGAGILILTDQDPETPLDISRISVNDNVEFRAVDLWELFWDMQNTQGYDPSTQDENFEFYTYYGSKVHKSRVMRLKGQLAPAFLRPRLRGWGFSVVEALVRSINQYLKATDLAFEVLDEFKIDIFKIKNLNSTLFSPGGEEKIRKRVSIANTEKNYNNALTMDSEDDWDHKQLSFAGLGDAMQQIRMQVASDMRMPLLKLFGIGAVGLNASSEDEIEVYNSMVESQVRNKIKYYILKIIEIKCQELFGFVPDDLSLEFKSLRVMSAEQEMNVKKSKSDILMQFYQAGVLSSTEVRNAINKSELLDISIDAELELGGISDNTITDKNDDISGNGKIAGADKADSERPAPKQNSIEFDKAAYKADGGDLFLDKRRDPFFIRARAKQPDKWDLAVSESKNMFGKENLHFVVWKYKRLGGEFVA